MPAIRVSEEKDPASDGPFILRNADSTFEGRSSGIFGQLDALERQHISHEQNRTDLEEFADLRQGEDDSDVIEKKSSSSGTTGQKKDDAVPSRGDCLNAASSSSSHDGSQKTNDSKRKHDRESDEQHPPKREPEFRQPSGRPPGRYRSQRGRVPDHGKKSQAWTHYSLDDVKGSDMSEKSNTQAALAFLDEQRKLKAQEEETGMEEEEAFDVGSAACSKGLFSFAKRNKTEKSSSVPEKEKPVKNQPSVTDAADQPDDDQFSASAEGLGADSVQTLKEEETVASSSVTSDDSAQTSFKSRKGIKRNIRSRDDDDD